MAEGTFSFDSASFFDSASYFGTLFSIDSVSYMHRNRKNSLVFLNLMVIFRALKDKRRVLVLRKGYNILVGREIS